MLLDYLIWFSIFALIGVIITKIKKHDGVRCGPYLGLSLLFTLIANNLSINNGLMISIVFLLVTIFASHLFLTLKGEWLFDEKNYQIF